MKGTKVAHPSQVREVTSPADLDRLLANGWCEIKKPVSTVALKARRFRARCKSQGMKRFAAYVPQDVFEELAAVQLPGEKQADLLIRLLRVYQESIRDTETD